MDTETEAKGAFDCWECHPYFDLLYPAKKQLAKGVKALTNKELLFIGSTQAISHLVGVETRPSE